MQGLKAKANGLNGHVNGRVTEMSTHLDGALNGVKPNLNSHAVLPRRHTTRRQRGFVARSFNVIARLLTYYTIFTVLFRCPTNLEACNENSPAICKPYFQVKQTVSPHIEPYYNTYAAPYVELARPYYDTINQRVLTPGWHVATKYAAPQVLKAQAYGKTQWEKSVQPQVQKYQALAKSRYDQTLAPHVGKVSTAVSPYYDIARTNALQTYHELLLPSYELLQPYAHKGFTTASSFTANTAVPSVLFVWNKTYSVVEGIVWPHVRSLYIENVEPQLVKIGQRLGRYSSKKEAAKTVKEAITTASKAASSFTKPTVSVSTTVASASVSTTSTATPETSEVQTPVHAEATPDATLLKNGQVQAPEWQQGEQEDAVRSSARETVAADLKDWQERYAKAADEGATEIQGRVDEIASRMIETNARRSGKAALEQLRTTVASELVTLRRHILQIVGAVVKGKATLKDGQDQVNTAVRRAGLVIKDKAQEVRTWRENYEAELHGAVTTAAEEHFKTLDTIRDLAVQKIGMKWAWMDGITYRDWQQYHLLKDRFDEWHGDLEKLIVTHPGLEAAQLEGATIEEQAMNTAQSAAKELARLKQVANWKLTAGDDSEDFDSHVMRQAAEAAEAVKNTAQSVANKATDKVKSVTESVAASAASASSAASDVVSSATSAAAAAAESGTASAARVAGSLSDKASSMASEGTETVKSGVKAARSVASEGADTASSAVESATAAASSVAGKATESAKSVVSEGANTVSAVSGSASSLADQAAKSASSAAGKATKSVKSVASEASSTGSSAADAAASVAGEASASGSSAASSIASKATDSAQSVVAEASNTASDATEAASSAAGRVAQSASSVAGKASDSAKSVVSEGTDTINSMTKGASSVAGKASQSAQDASASVKSAASSAAGKAADSASAASSGARSAASSVSGKASKSVSSASNVASSVAGEASDSAKSAASDARQASTTATQPDLASSVTEEILVETPVYVGNTTELEEDFPAPIELPKDELEEPQVVDDAADEALHATTTTSVKSAWFGAAAQEVPTRTPIIDDDSFDVAASVMSSMRNEMPSQFSSVAQSAYSNAVSRANAQYSQALSAVSVQIHGTPKPAHEQLLASVTSVYGNAMASASSRLDQALKAASEQFAAEPTQRTVNILPTAIPRPTVPSVDWERIESIASERLADGKAWAEEQYEAAKVRVGLAEPTPSTPLEHADKLLEAAKHNYYAGLGVAYARYSEFLSAASSAVSSMTATPTPTDFAGTVSSLASVASESAASVAAAAGENASAAGLAGSSAAVSAASAASASAASVASVASASAASAASVVGEGVSSVAAAGYEGASAGYDKAASAASVVADNVASVAASGYDNAASAASVVGENASSVAAAGYDAAASGYENVASAAGVAADSVSQNWDSLVEQLSVRVYGAPTPTPWYESMYSVLGDYASSVTDGASSATSGVGAYATAASTQAAEQYHVVSSIISELVIGKEPSFTDSVYSRLNSAYKTGAASAASLASVAQESAASHASAASEAAQSAGEKVASAASEATEAVKDTVQHVKDEL